MKVGTKILSALFITAVVIAGCTKQGATPNTSLSGKWRFVGSRQSSGGPQYWVPATNSNQYLQLNSNGTMKWTLSGEYERYTLPDSVTLTMSNTDGSHYQSYYYRIKGDSLGISPTAPVSCYEGCSSHFIKVK